jgi:hypothetical protein
VEFRDFAATHRNSPPVCRRSAEHSRQQLTKLQEALDEAARAAQAALEAAPPSNTREIDGLIEQLTRAATAHAEQQAARAVEPLRAEIASHADEAALLAGSLEESQGQADALG